MEWAAEKVVETSTTTTFNRHLDNYIRLRGISANGSSFDGILAGMDNYITYIHFQETFDKDIQKVDYQNRAARELKAQQSKDRSGQ